MKRTSRLFLAPLLAAQFLPGADLLSNARAELEKKVTTFSLPNGLQFLVLERHDAPVLAFNSWVKAGSIDDPAGRTGLAHMFEHMAFKGTQSIGTKDWTREKAALDEVDQYAAKLEQERRKGMAANAERIGTLENQLRSAIERATLYVDSEAMARIVEENGGVGLNAGTGLEATNYYYNFPSNRVELFFFLESERFIRPVFREFHKERDVVREERRERIESNPQGKLAEALLASAYMAHPYRMMPGGWASDIEHLSLDDAERFFKTYYVPGNIVIGIAGDITAAEARRLATKYFSRIPSAPLPPRVATVEPAQDGEKRIAIETGAQPMGFIAYKRPDQYHADDPVFDVLAGYLSSGRTGLLYKQMVRDKQLALAAQAVPTFPGGLYPSLFGFVLVPAPGHTFAENEAALSEIIESVKKNTPEAAAIERVKTATRAGVIRRLGSNSGMLELLLTYQVNYGDWRKLFQAVADMEKVTPGDVQRAASEYLVAKTRTVVASAEKGGAK